ncbi:hypothetical protein [Marinovum sp.]|uniref:hypothetical protein n=1 Tax=Marinovum sp. TaxID=2024839 RepID=UPI002B27C1D9|nr:hypothetical protein [Marinovum sp.]
MKQSPAQNADGLTTSVRTLRRVLPARAAAVGVRLALEAWRWCYPLPKEDAPWEEWKAPIRPGWLTFSRNGQRDLDGLPKEKLPIVYNCNFREQGAKGADPGDQTGLHLTLDLCDILREVDDGRVVVVMGAVAGGIASSDPKFRGHDRLVFENELPSLVFALTATLGVLLLLLSWVVLKGVDGGLLDAALGASAAALGIVFSMFLTKSVEDRILDGIAMSARLHAVEQAMGTTPELVAVEQFLELSFKGSDGPDCGHPVSGTVSSEKRETVIARAYQIVNFAHEFEAQISGSDAGMRFVKIARRVDGLLKLASQPDLGDGTGDEDS